MAELVVVPADEFAATAAERIARALDGAASLALAGGSVSLGLAGGSTPRRVYEALAARQDVAWGALSFFFGDERCVPPDDDASNYKMARAALLDRVPVAAERVHRMEGERADRDAAAAAYAALLPAPLDVLLLGLGPDGHTASLFPGAAALRERERRVVAVTGPKPPPERLTITPAVIGAARTVVMLAAGAAKAGAVARALAPHGDDDMCPARLARDGLWILDEAAAAELDR